MKIDIVFNQEGVKAHNYLRQLHGSPPLELNLDLASSAQEYADLLASRNAFQHSGNHNVGENLAQQSGFLETLSAAKVTLLWYNEIKDYNFSGQEQMCCGHFSQVIWKNTTSMGLGKAATPDGQKIIVVGHYQPPGNYIGKWGANVPPVVHGENRTLTLEELTKGTNKVLSSNSKENVVLFKNSGNESKEKNRKSSHENDSLHNKGKSCYTDFRGEQLFSTDILTKSDLRPHVQIIRKPSNESCKIQTKPRNPVQIIDETNKGVEVRKIESRSKDIYMKSLLDKSLSPIKYSSTLLAEPANKYSELLNGETSITGRKPSKNVNAIIIVDDIVVKRIRESVHRILHEIETADMREIGKELYLVKRPTDLQDKYSKVQEKSSNLSTPGSGYQCIENGKISRSDRFAMDVFMELNFHRLANGLQPFALSITLDEIAGEIAKDRKNGGDFKLPTGKCHGKVVHQYFESSCIFDKNARRFVQRCCNSRLRLAIMNPKCKYVAIGCDFDRPFKKSVAVVIIS